MLIQLLPVWHWPYYWSLMKKILRKVEYCERAPLWRKAFIEAIERFIPWQGHRQIVADCSSRYTHSMHKGCDEENTTSVLIQGVTNMACFF